MHARSTTIAANPSTIDRGIRYVRDQLLSVMLRVDGCRGLSLLVDRATGRCIATSSWEDERAMRASADQVRPLREDLIATFGGSSPTTDEWEIPLMHRTHESVDGACARVTWLEGDPTAIDNWVDAFRTVLPTVEALPGFCSASVLVNREDGLAVGTVLYDSADAIAQTRGQANTMRSRVAHESGAEVIEVMEFELAVAHLRIPELV